MMIDLTQQGMGLRCKRFVCIIEGGMVTHTRVGDEVGPVSAGAVEKVLDVSNELEPRSAVSFDKMLDKNGEPRTPDSAESAAETPDLLPVRLFRPLSRFYDFIVVGFIRKALLLFSVIRVYYKATLLGLS